MRPSAATALAHVPRHDAATSATFVDGMFEVVENYDMYRNSLLRLLVQEKEYDSVKDNQVSAEERAKADTFHVAAVPGL